MLYSQVGRANIDGRVYPDLDAFVEDTAAAYRAEIADLYAAGWRTCATRRCASRVGRAGRTRNQLRLSVKLIQATLRDRPRDLAVCTHICRDNFRSAWRARGGYGRIAEVIFNALPYDGFFREFDDARSGDFSPLRHVPRHVRVVLGLVTTKTGTLESRDQLRRRLDEASKYVALDQLCVSPQCGFSSTLEGKRDARSSAPRAMRGRAGTGPWPRRHLLSLVGGSDRLERGRTISGH